MFEDEHIRVDVERVFGGAGARLHFTPADDTSPFYTTTQFLDAHRTTIIREVETHIRSTDEHSVGLLPNFQINLVRGNPLPVQEAETHELFHINLEVHTHARGENVGDILTMWTTNFNARLENSLETL